MFEQVLKKVFGTSHERQLKKIQPRVVAIAELEERMKKLTDDALKAKTAEFKQKLDNGASLDDLLVPAFAVCREASKRALGMRHYDVQMIGGMVLHEGKIAEMKTGEGKTLVATLPCYLNGLSGKGVHVVTVNDYLARRDAEWMARLHNFLGLTVGVIAPGQNSAQKKQAYRADITYGQNNEFGFDYLRDNMKFSTYDYAQRPLNFGIVDEVDSILIDEARTPLIISGEGEVASDKYIKIARLIPQLRRDEHYVVDEKFHAATFTEPGFETAERLMKQSGVIAGSSLFDPANLEALHILNKSLQAHTLYHRDQQYLVSDAGEVHIIDEFRGRVLEGRRWSDGLHQAVEAKENVSIKSENRTLATISFQNLFRLYKKLSGMTGTADTEASEFQKIYSLDVVVIPTNRAISRNDSDDLIYKTEREKFKAVVEEICKRHESGQPMLVGTTSVEKSEALARLLAKRNVPFEVLNAKQHEMEAYVVAQAGRKGSVTVATNMAGRGTDILLGGNPEMLGRFEVMRRANEEGNLELLNNPQLLEAEIQKTQTKYETICADEKKAVVALGGLAILGTERHESRRIDNQLRGRAGRQGDPGASLFFLSLEDELMRRFGGDRLTQMMDRMGMEEDVPIEHPWVTKSVENAQKKVEEMNFDSRKNLLEYDDVMNQQRKFIYALRKQVLEGQYRTLPTEEEVKRGVEATPRVKAADPKLIDSVAKIVEQMIKIHGAPLPPNATPGKPIPQDELLQWQQKTLSMLMSEIHRVRHIDLERNTYELFGCRVSLEKFADNPDGARKHLLQEVGLSLTEQRERLFDLVDELISTIVEKNCPRGKHVEDWNFAQLEHDFENQFRLKTGGANKLSDAESIAKKLYREVENVVEKKMLDIGPENYLGAFRNFFLREIDREWLEHLSTMEHLRDGIGLRGYGQRDPKKEYKIEGYQIFTTMLNSVKYSVGVSLFRMEVMREEDVRRLEEQRRAEVEAQQKKMRTAHPSSDNAQNAEGQTPAVALTNNGESSKPATVKREKPKVGRNDPCWCGSGKKYKQCHQREDEVAAKAG